MFVWRDDKLLLIERARFPLGFAVPAGHVDGDKSFEESAERELREEVGLKMKSLESIFEGRKENQCRREGGNWHYWKLYRVETDGELKRSQDETKKANWYSKVEIEKLAQRTEQYLRKEILEADWEKSPGLEPVMLEFFKSLKII